jgi:hypothetical protein
MVKGIFFILNKICYVYLLKSKDKNLKVHFKSEVKNLFIMKIKEIRSHKDGKYDSSFDEFYSKHGIIHQTITLYSL